LLEDITYAQGRYKCPAKGAYKHNGHVAHLANGGECFVADSKEKSAHSNQYIGTEDFLPKLFFYYTSREQSNNFLSRAG